MALDEQRASRNADDDDGNAENQAEPKMRRPQGVPDRAIRSQLPGILAQAPSRFATPNSDTVDARRTRCAGPSPPGQPASVSFYTLARGTAKADRAGGRLNRT
jgi:hypothetical protein